jgi:PAS domain S-box-containing protein
LRDNVCVPALRGLADVVWVRTGDEPAFDRVEGVTATFGYSDGGVTPDWWLAHVHPADRNQVEASREACLAGACRDDSLTYRFRRADGEYATVEEHVHVTRDDDGGVSRLVGAARDVSARQSRKQDLRHYREVVDAVAAGMFVLDEDGQFELVNRRLERLTGYDRTTLLGEHASLIVSDEVLETHRALVENPDPGVVEAAEWYLQTASGETFPAEARITALATGDVDHATVWACADMTERERRERQLKRQNEQLDQFASVVSHDLRNPLNVLEGYISLLREECESDYLETLEATCDRMEALVSDLLELARQGKTVAETEAVSLGAVAEHAWATVDTDDAELRVETERVVQADETRLRQLFENLFRNSIDHAADDPEDCEGEPCVRVTVRPLESGRGFAVADDGPGIPPSDRDDVFDSGYTTDAEGTGFGLAIVRSIAEAHGWAVAVCEGEAGGARFEFWENGRSAPGYPEAADASQYAGDD